MIRLLSGAALLVIAAGAAWFAPSSWLMVVAAVVAALAFVEFARLFDGLGATVPRSLGLILTAAACVFAAVPQAPLLPVLLTGAVFAAIWVVALGGPEPRNALAAPALVFAPLYIGVPLGLLVNLHWLEGREVALLLMLTVIASDTSQYYAGRMLGRSPLAPTISPKKTVEGAIGGFVGGMAAMGWLGGYWLPEMGLTARLVLGGWIVGLGIVGDLFESAMKRAAHVKDSSALIPGHGGMLDRIDALLLATPAYFFALRYAWLVWR
ncbi:MAG TPA: phosphatidate cytidylyltransferase [Vicinamibacterales bacterium]